jgi:hypothetical protein
MGGERRRRIEMAFEMSYRTLDGRVVRGGMAFDSVSHAKNGCYLTPNGSMVTRKDWQKMKRNLALDDLPRSPRAPHAPTASDAEHRIDMVRHFLRGRGLDEESIEEACAICKRELEEEEPVEDELPENALYGGMGGALTGRSREPDGKRPPLGTKSGEKRGSSVLSEQEFRSSPASDSASFFAMFPDAARIGHTFGSPQFDPANPPPPMSKRTMRQSYDGADGKARAHLEDMLGFELPEVGPWPKRR